MIVIVGVEWEIKNSNINNYVSENLFVYFWDI